MHIIASLKEDAAEGLKFLTSCQFYIKIALQGGHDFTARIGFFQFESGRIRNWWRFKEEIKRLRSLMFNLAVVKFQRKFAEHSQSKSKPEVRWTLEMERFSASKF